MKTPSIGSLFSGYGGLEMGIQAVIDTDTAWHCEIEPAPSRILAHRWPTIPNLGDITTVDWTQVEPVDVLCGGFPCQDVSLAGLRRGLRPDTRSGLWSHFALAIAALRPSLVIVENVRGLLSAEAHSDLEPDPWGLGNREARPPLRALGAILGDLADLGYDATWQGIRAADAGAPHGRFRVFLLARPADPYSLSDTEVDPSAHGIDRERQTIGRGAIEFPRLGRDRSPADRRPSTEPAAGRIPAALDESNGLGADAHPDGERHGRREDPRMVGRLDRHDAGEARQRERARTLTRDRSATAPEDADVTVGGQRRIAAPGQAESGRPRPDARGRDRAPAPHPDSTRLGSVGRVEAVPRHADRRDGTDTAWGAYEPAIRRWEAVTGRQAPAPTEPVSVNGERLSPRFVEWMMGLPAGHVTDVGLTRSEQLKALGNGVVPQQAALALTRLLARQGAS